MSRLLIPRRSFIKSAGALLASRPLLNSVGALLASSCVVLDGFRWIDDAKAGLVAIDGSTLIPVGAAIRGASYGQGPTTIAGATMNTIKYANIFYGTIVTEDGLAHTIDTTGSSSLGWQSGSVTFANAGSTIKVGLATMDITAGPPGRSVNVADVITFDVSKSLVGGGGGIGSNAWNEHVPDAGTKTLSPGQLAAFAVQMTAFGGADSVAFQAASALTNLSIPSHTYYNGTYNANTAVPNVSIVFNDGKLGWFAGGPIWSTFANNAYNSGSTPNERGNILQFPFPVKVYGAYGGVAFGGNCDIVLYTTPLATPVAAATVSIDLHAIAQNAVNTFIANFSSPVTIPANTPFAIVAKPTSVTNVTLAQVSMASASHQKSYNCGTNGYAVTRSGGSGAFAAANSSKDRANIGALIGAFDTGGNSLIGL